MKVILFVVLFFSVLAYFMPVLDNLAFEHSIVSFFEDVNNFLNKSLLFLDKVHAKLMLLLERVAVFTQAKTERVGNNMVRKLGNIFDNKRMSVNEEGKNITTKPKENESKMINRYAVIEFKSGETLKAKVLSEYDNGDLSVEYDGFPIKFSVNEIDEIEYIDS